MFSMICRNGLAIKGGQPCSNEMLDQLLKALNQHNCIYKSPNWVVNGRIAAPQHW